jgi:transglutaminase-like putative cysteine protease
MKPPRFFLGAAVLFWGWQVHTLWIAICLGLILEFGRVAKSKFEFKPSDFNKFVDISTVFLAGTVVIALTIEAKNAILILLKWLPLIFFPIIAAQEFSVNGKIDIQSFFLVARKKVGIRFYEHKEIDVSYIYSFFCILCAGTANVKGHLFYSCIVLFSIWALWQVRSKRQTVFLWMMIILTIVISGYAGHNAIRLTRLKISQWVMKYYANYYTANPFKNYTALGEITKLKLSDKIILRASFEDYTPGKIYLLHDATYNKFVISNWFATLRFESSEPGKDNTFWQINPPAKNTQKMTIYFRPVKKRAVLSLPPGVVSISDMKTGVCEKNTLQSVRIEDGPSLIKAVVSYTDKLSYDAAPYDHDLLIPEKERIGIEKIAKKIMFENMSEQEILTIVKHYFLTNYTYSLDLKGKGEAKTPLQNFLNHTKAGHCEFFATATTLILRQAKIPARYTAGYIAHEYSRLGNHLIVRQRDAHAWVKVFINGQWENFDTTPPSFLQMDSQKLKVSQITDFLSFLGFKLSQLRHETGVKLMNQYGLWLTLPLGLILFFRLRRSTRIKRIRISDNTLKDRKNNNTISLYLIEEFMSQKGFPRYPYETYFSWLDRIGHHVDNKDIIDSLHPLLLLHNRLYFSQSGLKKDEEIKFGSDIKNMLKKLAATS